MQAAGEAGKGKEGASPLEPLKGMSLLTPWVQPSETHFDLVFSGTIGNQCVVLSHHVCGLLLQKQQESNTPHDISFRLLG